jgi:hypothetical protein
MSVFGPTRTFLDFGLRARRGIVTGVSMHKPEMNGAVVARSRPLM